jgi:hypothetical protein
MEAGEAIVIVPKRPGPLVVLDTSARTSSEIDDLVDELFGRRNLRSARTQLPWRRRSR